MRYVTVDENNRITDVLELIPPKQSILIDSKYDGNSIGEIIGATLDGETGDIVFNKPEEPLKEAPPLLEE